VFAGVSALAANKVFTVVVSSTKATACNVPATVVLDGADAPTFTLLKSQIGGDATGICMLSVWIGKSAAAAPAGTNLTVTWAAAQTSAIVSLDEWTGLDATLGVTGLDAGGTTQIGVQAVGANGTTATAHAVTLAALLSTKSCVLVAATQTASAGAYTNPGSVISAATKTVATPTACMATAMFPSAEKVLHTMTLSTSSNETSYAAIAVELQRPTLVTAYGTLSDATRDWFFGLEIPTPDGAVTSYVHTFDNYEPSAGMKVFQGAATIAGGSTAPVGTGFWKNIGFYDVSSTLNTNRTNQVHQSLNTSGFNYWIKLTRNMIMFTTKVGAAEAYNGALLIDSFITTVADPCPLMSFKVRAASNHNTFTNLPGITVVFDGANTGWVVVALGWTETLHAATTYNLANIVDGWASNKIHAGRIFVAHSHGYAAADIKAYGWARGLVKTDMLGVSNAGGTVNAGDTVTIDGATWTVIAKGSAGFSNSQDLVFVVRAT
jgi:hypothetical protein